MNNNHKLLHAIRMALFGGAAATLVLPMVTHAAQNDEQIDKKIERIEVTGSRIKRTDMENASPISVFSAEDIVASGATTLENFVQSIPAITGGAEGAGHNNGSRGFATASLRGLGSGRTLVLINGRRFASGDLNTIPIAYVARIEVLRDGASTVYGSDAIAGVINFITKKDFEGAEFNLQYDTTSHGDGEKTLFSVTTGASSDRGNVVLALQYTERKEIGQGDRTFSECPIAEDPTIGKYCGGSGTIPQGQFYYADGTPSTDGYVKDATTGTARLFDAATDAYNFASSSYMVTPQEVFSINGAGRYDITDTLTTFVEGGFTNRQSNQLMAPVGTFWSPLMPASNPYNITGEDIYVARRLSETGGRGFSQDFSDYRMTWGFEGTLGHYDWDLSYNVARFVDTRLNTGQVNEVRINTLLDPALCAADEVCAALGLANDTWDILTADTLTDEMLAYVLVPNSPVIRGETRQLQGNISGGLGIEFPGGEVMFATGFEKRWEEYSSMPDGAAAIGQIYGVSGEPTVGEYAVKEMYAEMDFPLLADLPLAESIRFTAAIRYSDFDFLPDSATNTKFGLEWVPIEGLLLRGTLADGFRAPGISELYSPQSQTNLKYSEPCANYGTGNQSEIVKANCAAEGLPIDFSLSSDQSSTIVGGNPDLQPEKSESATVGFVYSYDSSFTMSVDYFNVKIVDGIGTAGTDNVINGCWESANFTSPLCQYIQGPDLVGDAPHPTSDYRSALGTVSGILLTNANLSTFETSGYDFDVSYKLDLMGGDFLAVLNGTYLKQYDYQPFAGEDIVSAAGKVAADQWETTLAVFPRLRTNLSLSYTLNDWSVNWLTRYQSQGEDLFADPDNLDNIADAVWYHDLQGTYFILDNTAVTLGVRNLFDQQPPYLTANQDMNTIPGSYDTAGQYWYTKVNVRF